MCPTASRACILVIHSAQASPSRPLVLRRMLFEIIGDGEEPVMPVT